MKDQKLSDILDKIEDHNVKALSFAPKQDYHKTVEEEVDAAVANMLIEEHATTESIVADHFIQEGENIAKAMEAQAVLHENTAKDYRKLAEDARKNAKIMAKNAADHEERMKEIKTLLLKNMEG